MIAQMVDQGFLRSEHASMLVFDTEPAAILDAFGDHSPPVVKWQAPLNGTESVRVVIRIVAALVQDEAHRVLLVRKRGTRAFMQPGGKLLDSESHLAALERELEEELSCSLRPGSPEFLGTFMAPAANEHGCLVEAALYRVDLVGTIWAGSESKKLSGSILGNLAKLSLHLSPEKPCCRSQLGLIGALAIVPSSGLFWNYRPFSLRPATKIGAK